jgi:hypothetical protein
LEGFAVSVVVVEDAVDGGLKVDDGSEGAALQPLLAQRGEEALNGVEPRGGGRGEVEGPVWMTRQPFLHLQVLVSGAVVADRVDGLAAYRDSNVRFDPLGKLNVPQE